MSALDDMVYLPRLLMLGQLAETEGQGLSAIARGKVTIERWTISIAEARLPRWALRGVTITTGGRSIHISDDGARILHEPSGILASS